MDGLLIVSNNVLSMTKSNGKTLYSFIDGVESINVSQLYFSSEVPEIKGVNYFRISDHDVIRGRFNRSKRGHRIKETQEKHKCSERKRNKADFKSIFGKTTCTQIIRDLLWANSWKSRQLTDWIGDNNPKALLFCAGDSIFAYKIVKFIVTTFNLRLTIFITDDYVMPRHNESIIARIRRSRIRKNLKKLLSLSSSFYTISPSMQMAYYKLFGIKSNLAVNIPNDNRIIAAEKKEKRIVLVYSGSLYYGRDVVLSQIGEAIKKWNEGKSEKNKAIMKIYTNIEPDENIKHLINISDGSQYAGNLNAIQLQERLYTSDILVFVESFDPANLEKTKYSLSTKVPEYLQYGKPILAVGPKENGSMQMLKETAYCVNKKDSLEKCIKVFLDDSNIRCDLSKKAKKFYEKKFDVKEFQRSFIRNVMGE